MADRRRTVTSPSFDPGDIGGGGGSSDDDSGGGSDDSGSSGGGSSGGSSGGGGSSSVGSVTRDRGGAGAGGGGETTAGLGSGDDDSDDSGGGSPGGSTPPPTDVGGPSDPVPDPDPGPAPDDTASPPADVGGPATGADSGGSVGPSRQDRDDRTDGDAGASIEVPAGAASGSSAARPPESGGENTVPEELERTSAMPAGPGTNTDPERDQGGVPEEVAGAEIPDRVGVSIPEFGRDATVGPAAAARPQTGTTDVGVPVGTAERDREVVEQFTTGGVLSERGQSAGVVPDIATANVPETDAVTVPEFQRDATVGPAPADRVQTGQTTLEGTSGRDLEVDVSETRARETARDLSGAGEQLDAGAVTNAQAALVAPFTGGQGVQPTTTDVDPATDSAGESPVESAFEGAAQVPFDAPAGVLQAETAAEVGQAVAEGQLGEQGAGDVTETGIAVGRDAATRTAAQAQENPGEFAGAVGAGLLLGGAGAASAGTAASGLRAGLRAELDPRIGPLGTTAETQVVRGLRDRVRGDDSDTGGLTPDGDLGSGGSGPLLDADTVDAGRGVSDPSIGTRLRGDAERAGRSIAADINERLTDIRDRAGGTDRGQADLAGLQRPDGDGDGGGSPSSFDAFDGARRDDILAGSPRDRMSDDIADRTQAQRRQFGGDFEQPFDERGGGARTPADRATMNPDADQDTGPVAEAVARRDDAQQRFDRRGEGRRDGDATAARLGLGTVGTLGLAGGLFGGDADQGLGLRDRPRFDVGGRPDVDATPDIDGFTGFDFGQDLGSDTPQDTPTDTGSDIPTTDLTDPPRTDRPRDPTRDVPSDPPGDPPDDPPRDPPTPFDPPEDESDTDEAALFGTASADDLIDSGIQSGSDAAAELFGDR